MAPEVSKKAWRLKDSLAFVIENKKLQVVAILFAAVTGSFLESAGLSLFLPILDPHSAAATMNIGVSHLLKNVLVLLGLQASLGWLLCCLFVVYILKGLLKALEVGLSGKTFNARVLQFRLELADLGLRLNYQYLLQRPKGAMSTTLLTEANSLSLGFRFFLSSACHAVFGIALFSYSLYLNARLTLLAVFLGAGVAWFLRRINYRNTQLSRKAADETQAAGVLLHQSLDSQKYLKASGFGALFQSKITNMLSSLATTQTQSFALYGLVSSVMQPISVGIVIALVVFSVRFEKESVESLMVPLLLIYRFMTSLLWAHGDWTLFLNTLGSIEVLMKTRTDFRAQQESDGLRELAAPFKKIRLAELSCQLSNRTVLSEINQDFIAGKSYAIVGPSGSGKTTLVDIVLGIIRPSGGIISIDGVPLHEISRRSWCSRIGLVNQEFGIFSDTVANNISLWSHNPDDAESARRIRDVLEKAAAWDFVAALPKGIETVIGEAGIGLSGGEQQRLALARELYKNPSLLVLDEAASALDINSEKEFQKTVLSLKGEVTILLISHRLSLLGDYEEILVVESGMIIERGAPAELMDSANSVFRRMIQTQNMPPVRNPRVRIDHFGACFSFKSLNTKTKVDIIDLSVKGMGFTPNQGCRDLSVGSILVGQFSTPEKTFPIQIRILAVSKLTISCYFDSISAEFQAYVSEIINHELLKRISTNSRAA